MVSGVVLLCLFQPAFAEAPTEPAQIYDSLKNLEGKWSLSAADIQEGGTKTHPSVLHLLGSDQVAMEFKLIGRGSTVQEDLLPGTERQMVTMYHCKDSSCSAVKATHYCAKKNQPTDLCQSWDGHIHRITHELSEDGMHLRAVYSNFLNGEHTSDTVFHFDRIRGE
jgi:nicotinamide mononucleotide adenylyltransferase